MSVRTPEEMLFSGMPKAYTSEEKRELMESDRREWLKKAEGAKTETVRQYYLRKIDEVTRRLSCK